MCTLGVNRLLLHGVSPQAEHEVHVSCPLRGEGLVYYHHVHCHQSAAVMHQIVLPHWADDMYLNLNQPDLLPAASYLGLISSMLVLSLQAPEGQAKHADAAHAVLGSLLS